MVKRLAIIPARGGSKRIPGKNIVPFCGKPMIVWTIEAAQQSDLFDRILVSTDDDQIAEVSRRAGALVPFLRQRHTDDVSPVSLATIDALEGAEMFWGQAFDEVVQLMPNCPLRSAEDIKMAIAHFGSKSCQFQISAFRFGWMNPWWAMKMADDGCPEYIFPEARSKRSQDLESLYCPSGAVWVAKKNELLSARTFYGPGHMLFPMSWESALDIDEWADFRMAEAVAKLNAMRG